MKNLFKIAGAIVFAAAVLVTVSLSGKNTAKGITLASLTSVSNANAECIKGVVVELLDGRCSQLSGNCYFVGYPEIAEEWNPSYIPYDERCCKSCPQPPI